jgi:hypothetical protein
MAYWTFTPASASPVAKARQKLWKSSGLKSSEPAWMRQSLRVRASVVAARLTKNDAVAFEHWRAPDE